jgi:tmRNA-binding protein
MAAKPDRGKLVAENRKARFNYEIGIRLKPALR